MDQEDLYKRTLLLAQDNLWKAPTIILGSGASIPFGLPSMDDLAEHLQKSIKTKGYEPPDQAAWKEFSGLLKDKGLEGALQAANISGRLLDDIVRRTWELIAERDREAFLSITKDSTPPPLARLLAYLLNSTIPHVHIVTTNYDRIAEYCANRAEHAYSTGFRHGYIQSLLSNDLCQQQKRGGQQTVCIWKAHGSIDWFTNTRNDVVGYPGATAIPEAMTPAIVTPGATKYQQAMREPFRTMIYQADEVLKKARAFLCVGFGFNDEHIQPKLVNSWLADRAPLLILAKKLTPACLDMLQRSHGARYLALEEDGEGARALSHEKPEGYHIDKPLWRFDTFMEQVALQGVAREQHTFVQRFN